LLDYVNFVEELEEEGINVIGVSEVTDCIRRAYWRRVELLEPLSWDSLVRIMIGSAGHQRMAEAGNFSLMWTELPVAVRVNSSWMLLGRIDAYDPLRRELWELKTTSAWAHKNGKLPYEQHIWQVAIYRWMLRKNGLEPERVRILYMFRDARRSDWQWVDYDVTNKLPSDGEIEERVNSFVEQLKRALEQRDPSMLPLPDESERYKCEGCPWRNKCLALRQGQQLLVEV